MKVRVFRNLTRGCLSLQGHMPGKGWRTVAHASEVLLEDVRFVVSMAGRLRTVRTGRKCVHAWAEGHLTTWRGQTRDVGTPIPALHDARTQAAPPGIVGCPTSYNPKRRGSFVAFFALPDCAGWHPVAGAKQCLLHAAGGMTSISPILMRE